MSVSHYGTKCGICHRFTAPHHDPPDEFVLIPRFRLLFCVISFALGVLPTIAQTKIDLSGLWKYQVVTNLAYPPPAAWTSTSVPGLVTSTNYTKAWFWKTFALPALPTGYRIKLRFGAVKYNSTVYLNGQNIGGCYNGYDSFELDGTSAALPEQANELLVAVTDWTGLFSTYVDFSNMQPGESPRDHVNNVVLSPIGGHFEQFGIWEPVSAAYVAPVSVSEVFVMPSVRQQQLRVRTKVRNETSNSVSLTVHSRVLDGTNQVLVLPDQPVIVPAGTTLDVEAVAPWSSPRLWSPEDPYLYNVESSLIAGFATDPVTNRFGFREFWASGDSLFLNGTKIHLLATACWPPPVLVSDAVIRNSLLQVKAGNNKAIRLHTQPWPEAWYRIADEIGLLIVEEAAVWCDPRAYRLSDPVFWSHYSDHLKAAVRRDQNHPSIILWSLENEILHCGGDTIFSGTITNLAALGGLVKSLDPTRPITFEADLDPGGVADVLGLHYPHEFPEFADWPNTAYWMDQAIAKSYGPNGRWQWDRTKPLYIGEHLWISDTAAEVYSILYGDFAYFDPAHYRQLAKAWTWQMQIEAYRWYGVSAHCPWTLVEDPASGGIQNLNTNQNLLYQTVAAAYHPNAVVMKEYDRRFFVGEIVTRTLITYNDTSTNGDYVLQWRVNGVTSTRSFSLAPGTQRVDPVSLTVPAGAGPFGLEIELRQQGSTVFTNTIACAAYAPVALSLPSGYRVGLYDPAGTTAPVLAGLAYASVTNLSTAVYSQLDLLVIGRHALQPESVPAIGLNTISSEWQDFMWRGGRILVLEQTNFPAWMPLGIGLITETANFAFPVSGHPLVANLGPEDLRWWRGDQAVAKASLRLPSRGNFRPLAHVGSQQGLDRAALLEVLVGRGGMVCCQFLVGERFATEPIAGVLLQRLLNYGANTATPHYAGLLAEKDSSQAQTLQRVGLIAENILGRLATIDLNRFPVLILAGTNAGWIEAAQNLSALQAYVGQGGHLIVHRPPESFLMAAAQTFAPGISWSSNVTVPILRSDTASAPRRFTNHDLYWADDPGSWNRPLVLSTNIANRVYRKNFNLSTYTTLQVENMPTKTAGVAIPGGWNLNANGYVAQSISISQAGDYLFGVLAYGTPLAGVYPHMVLRIDGMFADAVTVTSSNFQLFTLSATLTTGTHEVALVFDNDAYAPPEDRNLNLDQVRYGLDPSTNPANFLTKPGAVVEKRFGNGSVLFDEIAWENPGAQTTRAERYLSSLLTDQGALLRLPGALRLEAENMRVVGVAAGATNNGIVWLYSSGRLESTVRFTETGTYVFDLSGYGTPAQGIYPRAELRVDGIARGAVDLAATQPRTFTIVTNISAGVHTVAVAFINDFYAPPEDRNLALDYLDIQPQPRPQLLDLYIPSGFSSCTVVWISQPGQLYDVEYVTSLSSPWQVIDTILAQGTAASWTDDGSLIGQPPFTGNRPATFYRVRQRGP